MNRKTLIKVLLGATLITGISAPVMYDSVYNLNNTQAAVGDCGWSQDQIDSLKRDIKKDMNDIERYKNMSGYEDVIKTLQSNIESSKNLILDYQSNMKHDGCYVKKPGNPSQDNDQKEQPTNDKVQQPQKNNPVYQTEQPRSYVKQSIKALPKTGIVVSSLYGIVGLLASALGAKYIVRRFNK